MHLKKGLLLLTIISLTLIAIFIISATKDDNMDMESFLKEGEKIFHEVIGTDSAILLVYHADYIGFIDLEKKGKSSWKAKQISGVHIEEKYHKLDGAYWYTGLAIGMGKVFDPEVIKVYIAGENIEEFPGEIIEVEGNRIWFFISDDLLSDDFTLLGLSANDEIIEEKDINISKILTD